MAKFKVVNTIGYEGKKIDLFIQQLKQNNVETVVDTRIRAGGRKVDFCKKNLTKSLNDNGIKYFHYRELGTPEYLMKIMKTEGSYSMEEYGTYLDSKPQVLSQLINDVTEENIAIMCFEKDYKDCHRTVIASRLSDMLGSTINHI
jgi:uncharacterized protein (DUF488 family)